MSQFAQKVVAAVQKIPRGKVVSYGQIAAYCGSPQAARQVGAVLRNLDDSVKIPWWRVINNAGKISIKGNWYFDANAQRALLEKEGVHVDKDFTLEIEKYRFALR